MFVFFHEMAFSNLNNLKYSQTSNSKVSHFQTWLIFEQIKNFSWQFLRKLVLKHNNSQVWNLVTARVYLEILDIFTKNCLTHNFLSEHVIHDVCKLWDTVPWPKKVQVFNCLLKSFQLKSQTSKISKKSNKPASNASLELKFPTL